LFFETWAGWLLVDEAEDVDGGLAVAGPAMICSMIKDIMRMGWFVSVGHWRESDCLYKKAINGAGLCHPLPRFFWVFDLGSVCSIEVLGKDRMFVLNARGLRTIEAGESIDGRDWP
jgi:hypothetical protein